MSYPPIECPTRTYGPFSPAACSNCFSSVAIWRLLRGSGPESLQVSGAVVGTHAGELRDLWLHHQPVNGRAARTALQYYRRRTLSATVDIHADRTSLNE